MSRNPVASAMSLVLHFFSLAGLYLTLQAQFVAVIQILVYAGAIMVLVVFVIMLLNVGREETMKEKSGWRTPIAAAIAVMLAFQLGKTFFGDITGKQSLPENAAMMGTTETLGSALFGQYLFPFEAISLLLLVAVVGAIILAKRNVQS
jgi:NADH-quinone oxidoreductase subunit J